MSANDSNLTVTGVLCTLFPVLRSSVLSPERGLIEKSDASIGGIGGIGGIAYIGVI